MFVIIQSDAENDRGLQRREKFFHENLFSGVPWDWMMAGSYTSHAIIEPDRVTVSHPGGFVEVLGSDYRPVEDSTLNPQLIQDSLEAQRRFLK